MAEPEWEAEPLADPAELVLSDGPVAVHVVDNPDLSELPARRPLLGFSRPLELMVDLDPYGDA